MKIKNFLEGASGSYSLGEQTPRSVRGFKVARNALATVGVIAIGVGEFIGNGDLQGNGVYALVGAVGCHAFAHSCDLELSSEENKNE